MNKGKLSLDDDIRQYVPEIPEYGDTITIRHLNSTFRDNFKIDFSDVKFLRNDAQEVVGFKIYTARVRGVLFQRVKSVVMDKSPG